MRKVSEHSAFICSWISVVIKVPFRVKDTQFVHPSCVLEATLLLTKWDWLWSLPKDPSFYPPPPSTTWVIAVYCRHRTGQANQSMAVYRMGTGEAFYYWHVTIASQPTSQPPIFARNLHEHLHHNDVDLHQQLCFWPQWHNLCISCLSQLFLHIKSTGPQRQIRYHSTYLANSWVMSRNSWHP